MPGVIVNSPTELRRVRRDLRTLGTFITMYCRHRHRWQDKAPVALRSHDVDAIMSGPVELCASCAKLLAHAFVKRSHCPMVPKPDCKHCPNHCYHPTYRSQIKTVMRYAGPRLVLRGRLDYLLHLLF